MIDITTDGEYGDHDDIKIVMTRDEARQIAYALAASNIELARELGHDIHDALDERSEQGE